MGSAQACDFRARAPPLLLLSYQEHENPVALDRTVNPTLPFSGPLEEVVSQQAGFLLSRPPSAWHLSPLFLLFSEMRSPSINVF